MIELEIQELGSNGDGIATLGGAKVFIPFALPGEVVTATIEGDRGTLVSCVKPVADRQKPKCHHHGSCGGCVMQHLRPEPYLAWKRDIVTVALRHQGLLTEVEPVRMIPDGTRRRAKLSCRRTRRHADLWIGYQRARSNELINIDACPVLDPRLFGALAGLKPVMRPLLPSGGTASLTLTLADNGLDADLAPTPYADDGERLQRMATEAGKLASLIRITSGSRLLHLVSAPVVRLGRASVRLPPGAFLQATRESEAIMTALVLAGIGNAAHVLDLYCGLGTFTFPMAERARVTAVEGNRDMVQALESAARGTPGIRPVRAICRDLAQHPFAGAELTGFDAAVFDPPRAGAQKQAAALALSKIPRVVAVSCNPGTLARDLRLLVEGGYRITRATPVDQFVYSSEVEVVAVLERTG